MKKIIILLLISLIILVFVFVDIQKISGFEYYKNKEYNTLDNAHLVSQSVNHQFLLNYKLNNFEDPRLDLTIENFEWEHNMQLLLKHGLYLRISEDSVMVCTKGFDENISDKLINIKELTFLNYLKGTDVILFSDNNIYQLCGIRPWEYRWFVNGEYQEDKQTRSKMYALDLYLRKLRPKGYSRSQLSKVLFHGVKNSDNKFDIECICQRQKVDSLIIKHAIRILQDSSYLLEVDEFYLPVKLPKAN
jgi:hypothetical protein